MPSSPTRIIRLPFKRFTSKTVPSPSAVITVEPFLGVVFILTGNYMPKCKQNYTIGIKVVWTLNDEENWYRTHRFAGRLWVIGGVVVLVTVLLPMESFLYALFPLVTIMALAPILYSYLYDRKQQKAEQK